MITTTHSIVNWRYYEKRNTYGDKYRVWAAVHGNGRVLCKIFGPTDPGGFCWDVRFCCQVPGKVVTSPSFEFISEDDAKCFVEDVIGRFDPIAIGEDDHAKRSGD